MSKDNEEEIISQTSSHSQENNLSYKSHIRQRKDVSNLRKELHENALKNAIAANKYLDIPNTSQSTNTQRAEELQLNTITTAVPFLLITLDSY